MNNKKIIFNTGDKVGNCTFLEEKEQREYTTSSGNKRKVRNALFRCQCGKEFTAKPTDVVRNSTRSCGCLGNQARILNGIKATEKIKTHGQSSIKNRSKEYSAWAAIKFRCLNPNSKAYKDYGERGILISNEWKDSFEVFLRDVGKAPTSKYTLDRRENDKGYYKDNCHWITMKEQSRNKRSNRIITYNNKTMCIQDWAQSSSINISSAALYTRILRNGWSMEKALTTPVKKYKRRTNYQSDQN